MKDKVVIDALRRELEGFSDRPRHRMAAAPVKLAADAPLRTLSPEDAKRLDSEAVFEAEVARAPALHQFRRPTGAEPLE